MNYTGMSHVIAITCVTPVSQVTRWQPVMYFIETYTLLTVF